MKKILSIALALSIITGCSNEKKETSSTKVEHKLDYAKQADWEFVSGEMQSPINIVTSDINSVDSLGSITTNYENELALVEDNGHAIEAETKGSAMINNRSFDLLQFHIHAKSEHQIDGKNDELEIHFVHKGNDGRLAVIGVLVETGANNAEFQKVLDAIDKEVEVKDINLKALMPESMSYYHYLGSLTTPPLTENVEWYILKDKITISSEQLKEFNKYYSSNNREVQPLNDRSVIKDK